MDGDAVQLRRPLTLLVAPFIVPAAIEAQVPSVPARPVSDLTVELFTRARWLHELQPALHTPMVETRTWINIDSIRVDSAAGRRVFWALVGNPANGDPATVEASLDGRRTLTMASLRERTMPRVLPVTVDTARMTRSRVLDERNELLNLPDARLWDLVPSFAPDVAQPGARWADTFALSDTLGAMRQSLRGTRTSVIERDTVVAGRRLWIVRDSAVLTSDDVFEVRERRLDALATIQRATTGTMVGRHLYDPSVGLARSRRDTTVLRGTATLRYPDGRQFESRVTLERTRDWDLYERAEFAARDAVLRTQRDSNAFSIVRVPRNEREERLSSGDTGLADSLFRLWSASRDPNERAALLSVLGSWGTQGEPALVPLLDSARRADGDLDYMFTRSARGLPNRRLTLEGVEFLLPYMRDPGLAFRSGVDRDISYEGMIETLFQRPPALEPDTALWGCEPAACRLLGQQLTDATEPRLRSVGLSVLAMTDPARWRDTFLAVAEAGDNVSQIALWLLAGHGNFARNVTQVPLPDSSAAWQEWYEWFVGMPAGEVRPPIVSRPGVERPPAWFSGRGNPLGARMVEVATGRDMRGELRTRFAAATNDTSRTLFGRILLTLGESPFGLDSIATYIASGSDLMRRLANEVLMSGVRRSGVAFAAVSPQTRDSVHAAFFSGVSGGTMPWRTLEESRANGPAAAFRNAPGSGSSGVPVFFAEDGISPPVRAEWGTRFQFTPTSDWRARPLREGSELWTLSPVERAGPFLRFSTSMNGRFTREAGQSPYAWASGTTYILMELDGEWVIVASSTWIT